MKLYGFGPTRSLRAVWGLRELGADFEFVPVNPMAGENQRPDFLALNPAGKVPVLVDGDLVIPESAAIVLYLAEKYPEKGLLPADLKERSGPRSTAGSCSPSQGSSSRYGRSASTPSCIRRTSACRRPSRLPARSSPAWLRCSTAT